MTEHNSNIDVTKYGFVQQLKALPFVERVMLFGSRARHDNIERADIDIALICPNATNKDWSIVLEIVDNADTLLKIDCVRFDDLPEDSDLRKNIAKEGVVL